MFLFFKKYRHGFLILTYAIFYILMFRYLETRSLMGYRYHVVHTVFDDMIPFCELFIVPYLLWFPYMFFTVLYFIFRKDDRSEYYQLTFNMMMGMTVFLVVSYVYPNMLHLRPSVFPRENIFTDMVRILYKNDTATNVLPSIHVFNSLAINKAITSSRRLRNHRKICTASRILTILIILSTMLLKQHSVIDVCLGCTMAFLGSVLFYPERSVSRVTRKTVSYVDK